MAVGKLLIPNKRLQKYTFSHVYSKDKTTKAYLSVGQSFLMGTLLPSFYGWWSNKHCFGYTGLFASLSFGDYGSRISAAIITSGDRGIGGFMKRFISLAKDIHRLK